MINLQLKEGKKLYFISDSHLGEPDYPTTREREAKMVSWLDQCQPDAGGVFLLGDIFDFWFEYRHVIPKGYVRLLGKLAQISDSGIPVYFFTGNHDMWVFDYLPRELNIKVHRAPQTFQVGEALLLIGHGDGLGPGERSYKLLKKVFANRFCQWLFEWIHPNWGFALANFWSQNSRYRNGLTDPFTSADQERIFQYCLQTEQHQHHDFYIFGHRHLALELPLNDQSMYYNIGEWIQGFHYGVFDGKEIKLASFN